jgi:tetratricopeptide (TPR) repeat protein
MLNFIQQQQVVEKLSQLFTQQRYKEFLQFSESYKTEFANSLIFLSWQAYAMRKVGDFLESKKTYETAIKQFTDDCKLYIGYGNLLFQLKEFEDAKNQYLVALSINGDTFDALFSLARVTSELNAPEEAIDYYARALELSNHHSGARIGMAVVLLQLGRSNEAKNCYKMVLTQDTKNFIAANNLANIYRNEGEIPTACNILENAIMINPFNPVLLQNYAACLVLDDELAKAHQCYESAIVKYPNNVELNIEFAKFLWAKGSPNAFEHIYKNLTDYCANPPLSIALMNMLIKLELFLDAKKIGERLLSDSPNNWNLLTLLSSIYRGLGDLRKAITYSKNAVFLAPPNNNVVAKNELGYSLLANKEADAALLIYSSLCEEQFNNQGWWTLYATSLKAVGDLKNYNWLYDYGQLIYSKSIVDLIHSETFENFNQQLLEELLGLQKEKQYPIEQTLRHGTQTREDLFSNNLPKLKQLKNMILERALQHVQSKKLDKQHPFLSRLSSKLLFGGSWSVVLAKEGYHKNHFHSQGWLSGIYYAEVPDDVESNGCGWLVFGKPEIKGFEEYTDYMLKPENGLLVLFPSYMWHGTKPLQSDSRRVTVVFDLIPD